MNRKLFIKHPMDVDFTAVFVDSSELLTPKREQISANVEIDLGLPELYKFVVTSFGEQPKFKTWEGDVYNTNGDKVGQGYIEKHQCKWVGNFSVNGVAYGLKRKAALDLYKIAPVTVSSP